MSTPAPSRAWWAGTAALLVCLFGIMVLPAQVLALRWPNNEFGNYLFFGPQFVFPFELIWSNDTHVFEGITGFVIDVVVWTTIAVGFGFFTRRVRTLFAASIGIFVVVAFTAAFHLVFFPALGWLFQIDGP